MSQVILRLGPFSRDFFFAFAALGFSLLGIPFLYQRLVFPPRPPSTGAAPQPGG